jgi:hypothetical protein
VTGPTNMLVIVLDALREDSISPALEVSNRCYRAVSCVATAPWTLPSCTSLLTGLGPQRHRHFWHSGDLSARGLVDALPSEFRKVGLVNNTVLQPSSQLDAGFDRWSYFADHRRPFDRAASLIRRARRRKPLFLVLHSNISHDYYKASASAYFDEVFPDTAGGSYVLGGRVIRWNGTTPEQRAAVVETYRASAMKVVSCARDILELARARDDFVSVVVSDHGEGLDYERARVHHGGRLHDDLLRVPLYFDLPSATPESQRSNLAAALGATPVATIDVLPTLFSLAGVDPPSAIDGRPIDRGWEERMVVSEERRYLYLKDRFRLNTKGRDRHMSPKDREENEQVQNRLAGPPLVRSYRTQESKLIMTCLHLRPTSRQGSDMRQDMLDLGQRLLGSPVLALRDDRLFAFELYNLGQDPGEHHNLLAAADGGAKMLAQSPWASVVTVPTGTQANTPEVGLSAMLEGAEYIATA